MSKKWIFAAMILLMIAILAAGIFVIRSVASRALEPITNAGNRISTQVSQFMNPTPTVIPDPVTIINQVRQLARLETIQYSVEKIITAETGEGVFGSLFGDKLLFVAHGIVIAGVDLSKIQGEDLQVRNGILEVHLPDPEIFIATLDNNQSYVYDRDTGIFKHPEENLETIARQAAEEEIRKAAVDDGILDQARINAEVFLERLFDDLGFKETIFT